MSGNCSEELIAAAISATIIIVALMAFIAIVYYNIGCREMNNLLGNTFHTLRETGSADIQLKAKWFE
jgi:hypothetical protein